MARSPDLKKLWLPLGLVLVAHAVGLEWLARHRDALDLLPPLAPPMYTRILQPTVPPPVVAAATPAPPARPKARSVAVAPKPKPAASEPAREPAPPPPPEPLPDEVALASPEPPAPAEAPVETPAAASPASAASAPPAAEADPAAALASWPTDTRLTYQLDGQFRSGPLYGQAWVRWQREGGSYQVRLDVDIPPWTEFVMTSQGDVTPAGLLPRAYEEYRPGKKLRAAQFGDTVLNLERGKTAPRPPGMQDTASQFVELAHRFATGREALVVGGTVTFPMARPGAVDLWTYDIVASELLRTPNLGTVEAFHLKPRPIANPRGNVTAEMWFAPSLQYLPVRIKVLMGDAFLDLVVEKIEQR